MNQLAFDAFGEIVVDLFAGGGGTSTGIEQALGVSPDVAINHDADALAMHAANHPRTLHLREDVRHAKPRKVCAGRPVGLLWLSPDCKHFSKAKGGKPRDKTIRSLAWVAAHWAHAVQPRIIVLENVEEFLTWGPLVDGQPCPQRKGQDFGRFVARLRELGYAVEWRELRACDFGAPTIRKRFFLIARRDGRPIVWPKPTHGRPDSTEVRRRHRLPWRTAAECIDWTLPCPSIFLTREEGRALGVKRPLAEATMRRIAKGVRRYVLEAAQPFIVSTNPQRGSNRDASAGLKACQAGAAAGNRLNQTGELQSIEPHHDTARPGRSALEEGRPAASAQNAAGYVVPVLTEHANASSPRCMPASEPLRTICAQTKGGHHALISANLIDVAHGEVGRNGSKRWSSGAHAVTEPMRTVTASGNQALVAGFLTKYRADNHGSAATAPFPTVTANGESDRPGGNPPLAVVAAHLEQANGGFYDGDGRPVDAPASTITATGAQQRLVASTLVKLRGTSSAADAGEPLHTVSAQGFHHAEVRAFLTAYYGQGDGSAASDPMRTVVSRERFGLVTVEGADYAIADIGLRMLTPRELFRAQGFPENYVIDRGADGRKLPKDAQVRMCGNSVCPPLARALVAANFAARSAAKERAA